ncbi:galactonate dehydratase [Haloplanus rallus]|uniref:Galactonate dehydratase n=1 Tax=Haloplanus rallus TaxID=1816183 RepID=A0A6B9F7I0_9EURY|nr:MULTISPECIES: galactonate dehydratase [Haloplanus]QGX94377.1 galactonate dehydratase [Haloplanus rallus]
MTEIIDYELYRVPPRWLFLKLETSDGTVGWGEPVIEGKAGPVAAAVRQLVDRHLLGEDPAPIEEHWQVLYRGDFYRGGPILMSAIAGIDQALWDIKGKRMGKPVYELLGGPVRDRMRVYQWVTGETVDEVTQAAVEKVEEGFTAVKMLATEGLERVESPAQIRKARDRVAAVREAVGPEVDIGVDLHGRTTKTVAKQLVTELEPLNPMFIEEPVVPEHSDAIGEIARHTTIPIATGERLFSRWDYKPLFEAGHVDIIQPDLSHAGGITEVRKIATMAEAYDISVAPHCPLGPIALASSVQVDATVSNAFIQEQSLNMQYNDRGGLREYLSNPHVLDYEGGTMELPSGPGLGVEIDEERVRSRSEDSSEWSPPLWRTDDGVLAEW